MRYLVDKIPNQGSIDAYWRAGTALPAKGELMAKFEVYVHGEVVETFEAERFVSKNDEYVFKDKNAETVGSITKVPGMSVKRVS